MDYLGLICKTIEEIENRINENIDIQTLAKKSFLSPFHFHRIFKAFTGHSIISYARKRRLHEASLNLINSSKKVIEIAFEYGYESNEAFSRALKKECGFTPSYIRKEKIANIGIEKMSLFKLNYEKKYDKQEILYTIVELKSFIFAGISGNLTLEDEKNYADVERLHRQLRESKDKIKNINDIYKEHQFGVAFCKNLDIKNPYKNNFIYYRAYEINKIDKVPKPLSIRTFNSCKCAKFNVGSTVEDHQKALYYIYGIWLPLLGYELNRESFELMEEVIEHNNGNFEIFIYIPIK